MTTTLRHPLPLLALLAACGADPAPHTATIDTLPGGIPRVMSRARADSGEWTLVLERVVQPEEGSPGELIGPNDLALTDDGHLLVADEKPTLVKVYGPDGAYLRGIGREGEGPGEFRSPWLAARGETLFVQDPRNTRATAFRITDGTVLNSRQSACCYYYPVAIDGKGRGVARMMTQTDSVAPKQNFLRIALNGSGMDTVGVTERPPVPGQIRWIVREGNNVRFEQRVPLRPIAHHAVEPTGGFVTGWSGEYQLRLTREGADTTMLFGREYTPKPISAEERAALADRAVKRMLGPDFGNPDEATLRAAFRADAIPDRAPAFDGLWSDPAGRRWVRLWTGDTTRVTLDLFGDDGRWLDQLTVPADGWTREAWQPVAWSRDRVAVLLEDADGRPLVKVYRIEHKAS